MELPKIFLYFSVCIISLSVKNCVCDSFLELPVAATSNDVIVADVKKEPQDFNYVSRAEPGKEGLNDASPVETVKASSIVAQTKAEDAAIITRTAVDHPPSQSTLPNTNTQTSNQEYDEAKKRYEKLFGFDSCVSTCEAVYNVEVDSDCCKRGCRLHMIIASVDVYSTPDDINNKCIGACRQSYINDDNNTACKFSCESQLPSTQRRRQELVEYEREQQLMSVSYSLMVMGMLEQITHQFNAHWSAYFPSPDGGTIIVGFNSVGEQPSESQEENGVQMLMVVEGKEPGSVGGRVPGSEGEGLGMSVLKRESQGLTSPKSLVFFVGLGVVVMIWYSLVILATSRARTKYQKLSINGDLDYLTTLDDKHLMTLLRPQEACLQAPPLPIKIQINTI